MISTGGSSIAAAEALREADADVLMVAAIFSYELEKGTLNFKEAELDFHVLTSYTTLVQEAKKRGTITEVEQEKLAAWRNDPQDVSWMDR